MNQTKTLDFALEVKSLDEDGVVEGFASTYTVDQGGDRVMPGAFMESLVNAKRLGRKITMNWNHNPDEPIGVWQHIAEEAKGLFVRGQLLKDAVRRSGEVYALLKAGAIGGLSIGYRIPAGGAEPDERRPGITNLRKIDLREISLVGMPMNLEARVTSVKATLEAGRLPGLREFEDFLRESGFSRSLAAAIACKAAPVLRGEPEVKAVDPVDVLRALLAKVG